MASPTHLHAAPTALPATGLPVGAPIRVGIIGATGYVGGELIRILAAHPAVELVGLTGRERRGDPVGNVHPHLATTELALESELDGDVDAVFLALPHGAAALRVPDLSLIHI